MKVGVIINALVFCLCWISASAQQKTPSLSGELGKGWREIQLEVVVLPHDYLPDGYILKIQKASDLRIQLFYKRVDQKKTDRNEFKLLGSIREQELRRWWKELARIYLSAQKEALELKMARTLLKNEQTKSKEGAVYAQDRFFMFGRVDEDVPLNKFVSEFDGDKGSMKSYVKLLDKIMAVTKNGGGDK